MSSLGAAGIRNICGEVATAEEALVLMERDQMVYYGCTRPAAKLRKVTPPGVQPPPLGFSARGQAHRAWPLSMPACVLHAPAVRAEAVLFR
jgi:hypothetical protein